MTREEIMSMTAVELVDEYEKWTRKADRATKAAEIIKAVEIKAFIWAEMIERMNKVPR